MRTAPLSAQVVRRVHRRVALCRYSLPLRRQLSHLSHPSHAAPSLFTNTTPTKPSLRVQSHAIHHTTPSHTTPHHTTPPHGRTRAHMPPTRSPPSLTSPHLNALTALSALTFSQAVPATPFLLATHCLPCLLQSPGGSCLRLAPLWASPHLPTQVRWGFGSLLSPHASLLSASLSLRVSIIRLGVIGSHSSTHCSAQLPRAPFPFSDVPALLVGSDS